MKIHKILLSAVCVSILVVGLGILYLLNLMSPVDDVAQFNNYRPSQSEQQTQDAIIEKPLKQPATNADYAMGGNFDFLIEHRKATILVKGSANYIPGALNGLDVDALFIGSAQLGMQSKQFQKTFIEESIKAVSPEIIVPLHWDSFITPWVKGNLTFNPKIVDDSPAKGLELLSDYAKQNDPTFYLLQSSDSLWIKKRT